MVELQKLCDKVPSFDSKIAFDTMERELGRPVNDVFSYITPEPVAAASLGQVVRIYSFPLHDFLSVVALL
jgi:aarF domain-containing kinase